MNYRLRLIAMLCVLFPFYAYAGGNPEFVKLPQGYHPFVHYGTMIRANQKQVARLYVNHIAISSYQEGQTADPGSVVIMEIYKPKLDDQGKPIMGSDGVYKIDSLAAIAVMKKKASWDDSYSEENRAGNWGFALYKPDGTPMSNDLNCAQCHTPLEDKDYLFTYEKLVDYADEQD